MCGFFFVVCFDFKFCSFLLLLLLECYEKNLYFLNNIEFILVYIDDMKCFCF